MTIFVVIAGNYPEMQVLYLGGFLLDSYSIGIDPDSSVIWGELFILCDEAFL